MGGIAGLLDLASGIINRGKRTPMQACMMSREYA
jgi:hypothetical protein